MLRQSYMVYKTDKIAKEARLCYEQAAVQGKPTPTPTATPASAINLTVEPVDTEAPSLTPTPKDVSQEFLELRRAFKNDDIVGYLQIPGTSIGYPVTQSSDNAYYLRNDINKQKSPAGWVFMDYRNNVGNDDPNTVIYGHNMQRDIIFHSLRYYQDWDYFNKNRYIIFNTIYENDIWEVFSFYKTDISFIYNQVVFPTEQSFFTLETEMKSRSLYDTGVDIKPGDHILTLSTCTDESEDTRFVLNARRLSPDEIPEDMKELVN